MPMPYAMAGTTEERSTQSPTGRLAAYTSNAAPEVSLPPVSTRQPDFQAASTSLATSSAGSSTGSRILWYDSSNTSACVCFVRISSSVKKPEVREM